MSKSVALARARVNLTWWDRFLIGVAPTWGLNRVKARTAATAMARHYEATGGGRRTAGWRRSSTDANAASERDAVALRELARDIRRNNGWARRGAQAIVNNTIGWGIEPKPAGTSPTRGKKALALWKAWAESSRCDFDGRLPFSGLQRLVMETIVESGEVLVVRQPASTADGLPVPMRIQVLEPDYLDTSHDGIAGVDGGPIVGGVEFDKAGRRVAYWLYTCHPGSTRLFSARFESQRVPAERVLHIFRVERPGQIRGVSWFASAIARLNDFDDYEDAVLMQQKVAACFGAFVHDDGAGTALGEQDDDDETLETLEPGHVEYLSPGKTVSFAQPPSVTDSSFTTRNLRRIAASLGVTFEDLTGDYSQVNFSSARMARLAHWANVHDWRWNMVIPQLCDGVWRWLMELGQGLNGWPDVPRAEWAPPPMPMLEPEKEGLAYQRLVRTGAMTLYQMIQERGEDPIAHLDEIQKINAELDARGIVLDCDPRRTSAAGGVQQVGGAAAGVSSKADEDDEDDDDSEVERNARILS